MMQNEAVLWYLCTETGASGPYTAAQMLNWTKIGCVMDHHLVRTQLDPEYYPLSIYKEAVGGLPFMFNVLSMSDVLVRKNAMLMNPPPSMGHCPPSGIFQNPQMPPGTGFNPHLPQFGCFSPMSGNMFSGCEYDTDGESHFSHFDENHNKKAMLRIAAEPGSEKLQTVPESGEKSCQTEKGTIVISASKAADVLSQLIGFPVAVVDGICDAE